MCKLLKSAREKPKRTEARHAQILLGGAICRAQVCVSVRPLLILASALRPAKGLVVAPWRNLRNAGAAAAGNGEGMKESVPTQLGMQTSARPGLWVYWRQRTAVSL